MVEWNHVDIMTFIVFSLESETSLGGQIAIKPISV